MLTVSIDTGRYEMNSITREIGLSAPTSRPSRPRLLTLLLLAGVALLVPTNATAAGTGTISGNLTDSANHPLADVCVAAYDSSGESVNYAISNANGNYKLPGLETGTFRVGFFAADSRINSFYCNNANVLDEYYDNETTFAAATPVSVIDGFDTPDIDAQLATGGSISGTVTVAPNFPESGICVGAYDSDGHRAAAGRTDSAGSYSLFSLETGNYRIQFEGCKEDSNVFGEFYPDKEDLDHATPISVTAGSNTANVNAQLDMGGSISGTVEGGVDAIGFCDLLIQASGAGGQPAFQEFSYYGEPTDYRINKLRPGNYLLSFNQTCVGPVPMGSPVKGISEYFNDKQSPLDATLVSVTAGSVTTGINVLLGTDGTISGTVTDSNGTPLDGICVEALDSNGDSAGVVAHTTAGHYVVNALNTGSYRLKFSDCLNPSDPSVATEYSGDRATLGEAVPVSVTKGADTSGIDAQLAASESPVYKGAIGKVSVKGPAKVKKGRKVSYRVKITNSGDTAATGVVLKVKGRGVSFDTSVGTISAGATKTVKAKLKPKKPGKAKLTFKVTSANAGGKSVKRVIVVVK